MRKSSYKILKVGIQKTSEAEIGKDIFYECGICQSIIPSMPKDNIHCSCGNIGIDKDLHRLSVREYANFTVLKKKP